jgi:hypothetical protein
MPRETAHSAKAQSAAPADRLNVLADENGATVNALLEAGNAMLQGWMTLSQELIEFSSARWREQLELSQRLLGCSDPNAAFDMQCELARAASRQFFDEAAKLMDLAAKAAQSSWAPLETRTKQALGRLNSDE